jgi:hypothetical protein
VALNRYRFYLGPLGSVAALPAFTKPGAITIGGPSITSPAATPVMLGVQHTSLSGRQTYDRFATKRSWQFQWGYLHESDMAQLEACYRIFQSSSSIYLLDARRKNALSYQVSSGGSEWQSTAGFTASAGTLAWSSALTIHSDVSGLIPGGQVWTPTASGQTLLSGLVPVVAGSYYTLSVYASGSGTASLIVVPYNAAGGALTATTGTAVTLSSTPARYSLPVYYPISGAASLLVGLQSLSAGTTNTYGWQLEMDQAMSAFSFGNGFPQVIIPTMTIQYPRYGKVDGARLAVAMTAMEV